MQTIQVGPVISNKEKLYFGVSQGSDLEPLLFLIYMNDIYRFGNKFNFYSYLCYAVDFFDGSAPDFSVV